MRSRRSGAKLKTYAEEDIEGTGRGGVVTIGGRRIPMALSLLVWSALWEIVGRLEFVFLISPFTDVLAAIGTVLTSTASGRNTDHPPGYGIGMALALVVGIGVGFWMAG